MNSPAPTSSWIRRLAAAGVVLCTVSQAGIASDDGVVRIGGTGMALAAMQQAGAHLNLVNSTVRVEVLPSLGTPGGLKALTEGAIDIAVVGRSLTAAEKAQGAAEATCATTPLVFASSHPAPPEIATADYVDSVARLAVCFETARHAAEHAVARAEKAA
jgi:phosphate transport system substrate-binding protein